MYMRKGGLINLDIIYHRCLWIILVMTFFRVNKSGVISSNELARVVWSTSLNWKQKCYAFLTLTLLPTFTHRSPEQYNFIPVLNWTWRSHEMFWRSVNCLEFQSNSTWPLAELMPTCSYNVIFNHAPTSIATSPTVRMSYPIGHTWLVCRCMLIHALSDKD